MMQINHYSFQYI
ncbi:hypothetical protein F383_31211 [Gossypium arboreum]|uniref:Uncharacterized protein n=1 Tax=Gossypium arboreum TaxID=29729 RepID=A0A0B0NGX1_GOSAR|nr:hypothetical protein F383_37701 [Gossypium arboreum]KHG24280.1 hypothetical protein F383_31211 [Gossypium arboreum]